MAKIYKHLTTQERAVSMTMRDDACSIRSIAKRLCRSHGTISREIKRTTDNGVYDANVAHIECHARRLLPRRLPKLHVDGALFQVVRNQLKLLWSPQQPLLGRHAGRTHDGICGAGQNGQRHDQDRRR